MARKRQIAAGEFKSHCLSLLDEVARTGEEIVVTKRGQPVARLVPLDDSAVASLEKSVIRGEDIVDPVEVAWRADR